ncbi:MAG: ABC transporter ATP-binding protein [Phycisphaerae bacterium]|jgi:ABC-type lipoprotein export system ATPase subunit
MSKAAPHPGIARTAAAEARPALPLGDVILRANGLHKSFAMGRAPLVVLADCSLSVQRGEFVAIMGKSGSGKSTLLHVLGALDVPQRGEVLFENEPVFAPPERRRLRSGLTDVFSAAERRRNRLRARAFGFVFQFYHLLPELNVLENVILPRMIICPVLSWAGRRAAVRREAAELLDRVGLAQRLRHKPNELSGGERQRVAIARALINQPQVLLADEPTGNLDAEAGENILEILKRLHAERQTIVMVTHDPGVAERADRVLRLEAGRLHPA